MRNTNMDMGDRPRHRHHRSSGGGFFKGLFWGAAIGAVLGVLFAPDKGEVTRRKVKKAAKGYEEKGRVAVEQARVEMEKAKEKYEELKYRAEPVVEKAREKASEVREFVEENKEPVLEALEDLSQTVENEAKKIKKRYFKGLKKR